MMDPLTFSVLLIATVCVLAPLVSLILRRLRPQRVRSVAFFHPYCDAGGGGERVLWCAVAAIQKGHSSLRCVIYTGDTTADLDIVRRATSRFNIPLDAARIRFVRIRSRSLLEARLYPVFTLLGQSIGGFIVALECLLRFRPAVFIDSTGCAFTLPVFRLLALCKTAAYVHYPTISTDMLERVRARTSTYNNASIIAGSRSLTRGKLLYYRAFAWLYGQAGRTCQVTMVNSSWTQGHIDALWNSCKSKVVYPPCSIRDYPENVAEDLLEKKRDVRILSIGQFRPEKAHDLQLCAFAKLLKCAKEDVSLSDLRFALVFLGGCRNEEDETRVSTLKARAAELEIPDSRVEWLINVDNTELRRQLSMALIGLHAMWNEHFGICVVENMAASNIALAHNSGGPKLDIVREGETGFLADCSDGYSQKMIEIVKLTKTERHRLRRNAKEHIEKFSEEAFSKQFLLCLAKVL